jgi:hypothetical protein
LAKQDINRQREDDHLEREKNREWQESLKAMNDISKNGSLGAVCHRYLDL